ncbi:MAG: hypothetical protein V3V35_02680 [Dehalococcoidia bacterium]
MAGRVLPAVFGLEAGDFVDAAHGDHLIVSPDHRVLDLAVVLRMETHGAAWRGTRVLSPVDPVR